MKKSIIYILFISLSLYLSNQSILQAQNDIDINIDFEKTMEAFKNKQEKKVKGKKTKIKRKDTEKNKEEQLKGRKIWTQKRTGTVGKEVGVAPDGYDLSISELNCPTTVTMGDAITISGYITNYGGQEYDDKALRLGFQVETAPVFSSFSDFISTFAFDVSSATSDFTDLLYPLVKVVPPSQNVFFEETINIDPAYFSKGKNIVIIWPTKVEVNDLDNSNNYIVKEIYVE